MVPWLTTAAGSLFLTHCINPSITPPSKTEPQSVHFPHTGLYYPETHEPSAMKRENWLWNWLQKDWQKPVGKTYKETAQEHPKRNHRRKFRAWTTRLKEAMRGQCPFKATNTCTHGHRCYLCDSIPVSVEGMIEKAETFEKALVFILVASSNWKHEDKGNINLQSKNEIQEQEVSDNILCTDLYTVVSGILCPCCPHRVPRSQGRLGTQYCEWPEWSAYEVDPLLSMGRKTHGIISLLITK